MTVHRESDKYYQSRVNFSHAVHVLSSSKVFVRLNHFEKRFLKNMTKYTAKEVFPTIPISLHSRVHNMYSKYVDPNEKVKL